MIIKQVITYCIALGVLVSCNKHREYENQIIKSRINKHQYFLDPTQSPLSQELFSEFKGLKYFDIDPNLRIEAEFKPLPFPKKTTLINSEKQGEDYFYIGKVKFKYNNQSHELLAYVQNETDETLFIPFTDNTTGKTTYYTGRYINVERTKNNNLIIDFNLAYSPYCAYNSEYVCAIPPNENALNFNVNAGEKLLTSK